MEDMDGLKSLRFYYRDINYIKQQEFSILMEKAVVLFSGGLDSCLVVKVLQEQDLDVIAFHYINPFSDVKNKNQIKEMAEQLKVKLHLEPSGSDYLKIIQTPKYGYGKNMNPCIDCKIFMFKKAKEFAKKIGAEIIATGEVLGERPMSQNKRALMLIEKDANLEGKLLRPLSAKLLEETEVEKNKLVDRNKLLAMSGRNRKPQIELAKKYGIKNYMHPAGGCLLTHSEFSAKLKDFLKHEKEITFDEIKLLKIGRHFRINNSHLIVGRDKNDNEQLLELKKGFEVIEPDGILGPIALFKGKKEDLEKAAKIVLRYSDTTENKHKLKIGSKITEFEPMKKEDAEQFRVK